MSDEVFRRAAYTAEPWTLEKSCGCALATDERDEWVTRRECEYPGLLAENARLREAASGFSEACEWIDRQLIAYAKDGFPLPTEIAYDAGSSRVEWRKRLAALRGALAEGESR